MKKLLLWMVFLAFCPFVWAQSFQITQNSYQKVSVSFTSGSLSAESVSFPEGDFSAISMPDYISSYVPGAPQLPQLCKLLQIPVCDSVVATVVDAQYQDYDAIMADTMRCNTVRWSKSIKSVSVRIEVCNSTS